MTQGNPFCPSFDSSPCSRCKATGKRHSPGTGLVRPCFPCSGTGLVLTRRGRLAREFMRDRLLTPVHGVKVGDKIWFCTELRKDFAQVVAIRRADQFYVMTGKRLDGQAVTVQLRDTDQVQWGHTTDQLLQIRKEVEAYQSTLTQTGYPRKQPAKLAA